eukprot:sb/3465954/
MLRGTDGEVSRTRRAAPTLPAIISRENPLAAALLDEVESGSFDWMATHSSMSSSNLPACHSPRRRLRHADSSAGLERFPGFWSRSVPIRWRARRATHSSFEEVFHPTIKRVASATKAFPVLPDGSLNWLGLNEGGGGKRSQINLFKVVLKIHFFSTVHPKTEILLNFEFVWRALYVNILGEHTVLPTTPVSAATREVPPRRREFRRRVRDWGLFVWRRTASRGVGVMARSGDRRSVAGAVRRIRQPGSFDWMATHSSMSSSNLPACQRPRRRLRHADSSVGLERFPGFWSRSVPIRTELHALGVEPHITFVTLNTWNSIFQPKGGGGKRSQINLFKVVLKSLKLQRMSKKQVTFFALELLKNF